MALTPTLVYLRLEINDRNRLNSEKRCFWGAKTIAATTLCMMTLSSSDKLRRSVDLYSTAPISVSVVLLNVIQLMVAMLNAGNTKGGSITVPLTSSLTGLESAI